MKEEICKIVVLTLLDSRQVSASMRVVAVEVGTGRHWHAFHII